LCSPNRTLCGCSSCCDPGEICIAGRCKVSRL
jgi:hypothetical protein